MKIVPGGAMGPNSYRIVSGDLIKTSMGRLLVNAIAFVRCFLLMTIFLVINILLLCSSVKFVRRKRDLLAGTRFHKDSMRIIDLAVAEHQENSEMLEGVARSRKKSREEKQNLSTEQHKTDTLSACEVSRSLSKPSQIHQCNNHHHHHSNHSSSEWNLTKMTLLIALIYLLNMLFLALSFAFTHLDYDNYTVMVVLDLIAVNFVQITNLFEIISYFMFNRFFCRNFRRLAANVIKIDWRK